MQKYTLKQFIHLKMAYSCCFQTSQTGHRAYRDPFNYVQCCLVCTMDPFLYTDPNPVLSLIRLFTVMQLFKMDVSDDLNVHTKVTYETEP